MFCYNLQVSACITLSNKFICLLIFYACAVSVWLHLSKILYQRTPLFSIFSELTLLGNAFLTFLDFMCGVQMIKLYSCYLCNVYWFQFLQLDFSALNDLLEIPEDEIIYLLHIFCERLQVQQHNFLDGIPNEKILRICSFLDKAINFWIQLIKDAVNKDFSSAELTEDRLAVLWGTIGCYPYMIDAKRNPSLLMDLIYAIDELLTVKSGTAFYQISCT